MIEETPNSFNPMPLKSEKRKNYLWIVFVVLIILIFAGYGIYKLFLSSGENNQDKNLPSQIACNVGSYVTASLSTYGMYGGEIKGIEKIELRNGSRIDLCCSEGDSSTEKRLKVCSKTNENLLVTYDIWFEFSNGVYKKVVEKVPEIVGGKEVYCEYYYDSSGGIESRTCY